MKPLIFPLLSRSLAVHVRTNNKLGIMKDCSLLYTTLPSNIKAYSQTPIFGSVLHSGT